MPRCTPTSVDLLISHYCRSTDQQGDVVDVLINLCRSGDKQGDATSLKSFAALLDRMELASCRELDVAAPSLISRAILCWDTFAPETLLCRAVSVRTRFP